MIDINLRIQKERIPPLYSSIAIRMPRGNPSKRENDISPRVIGIPEPLDMKTAKNLLRLNIA